MDVITACIIGIFINILDPDTYLFPIPESNLSDEERQRFEHGDFNAMSKIDRMACTYVRGLSWSLLERLHETLIFRLNGCETNFIELTTTLLLETCAYLWTYKMRTPRVSVDETTGCNLRSLKRQLEGLFNENTHIRAPLKDYLGNIATEITNLDTSIYTVERRETSQPHKYSSCVESMMRLGLNPSDNQYYTTIFVNIDTMMNEIKHINEGENYHYHHRILRLTILDTRMKGKKRKHDCSY